MARDYSNYSKEKLISYISELEKQLKSKKYGIYWDSEIDAENVVKDCVENIPVLLRDDKKTIISEKEDLNNNIIIKGDNFRSLSSLKMLSGGNGLAEIIYIDPPYNTLHKTSDGGFKYNDSFVDENDMFKHSEYLNFMNNRLKIAKDLLTDTGTIFISIDDHECSNLKLLCDSIFGPKHFVTMIPRLTKPQRAGQEDYMDISHDYVLVYTYNSDFKNVISRNFDECEIKEDKIGKYIPGDTKAILAAKSQGYSKGGDYDFEYNGKVYKPVTKNGERNRWLWTKERMQAAADLGILVETKSTLRMQVYIDKRFEEKTNIMVPKESGLIFHTSDFMSDSKFSNPRGVSELSDVDSKLTDKFNNPKPLELIKTLIKMADCEECVVLDFFAGSGTTGQAVLELNEEDGYNRKFILCTNNENNICDEVTYKRIKTVITGTRDDGSKYSDGIKSNLIFYDVDYIKNDSNSDQAKYSLVEKVNELLCIQNNIYILNKKNSNKIFYHYHSFDNKYNMFIYSDIYEKKSFDEFVKLVNKTDGIKKVYIYSNDNTIDETRTKNIKGDIEPIPSKIYEIYKEIIESAKEDM